MQTLIARHCHRHDHHQKVILAITNIFYFKSPYSIPASFVTTPCQGHQAIKQVQAKNSELQVSLWQFLLTPGHLDRLARLGGFLTSVRNLRHGRGHPPSHRHGRLVLHHIQEVIQLPYIPVVVSEKAKYCRFLFRETIICTLRGRSNTLAPPHCPLVPRRLEKNLSFPKVTVFNPPVLFGVSFLTWSMPLGPMTSSL